MARPLTPLISRESIIDAALRIVDGFGVKQLSIRRIGSELGVNGTSVYHYFPSKEDIVDAVASRVLSRVRPVREPVDDWKAYLVETCLGVRRAVSQHPNVTPVLAARRQWKFGLPVFEQSARVLSRQGIPSAQILMIWQVLDALTIRDLLVTASGRRVIEELGDIRAEYPAVFEVLQGERYDEEEALAVSIRAFLNGIEGALKPPAGATAVAGDGRLPA